MSVYISSKRREGVIRARSISVVWYGNDYPRDLIAELNREGHWRLSLRFGKQARRGFSERYQGQFGIPKHWHYLLGGRVAWKLEKGGGQDPLVQG